MSMSLFTKIIDDAATIPEIASFVMHGLGEPALDPHMVKRIQYIRGLDLKQSIELYSNGIAWSHDRITALKDAGLTCMVFSLNAVRPEQHDAIMGTKGKFDIVCSNIEHAIKTGLKVEVHAVSNDDKFIESDRKTFYERWGDVSAGGYGQCVRETNWAGLNRVTFNRRVNECCTRAISQIYVLCDGRVSMCCFDPTGKTTFGDLNKQSIRDIYNAEKYTLFRELHSLNRAAVYKACAGCTRT